MTAIIQPRGLMFEEARIHGRSLRFELNGDMLEVVDKTLLGWRKVIAVYRRDYVMCAYTFKGNVDYVKLEGIKGEKND